jgi:GT2 family glycosyltransferase
MIRTAVMFQTHVFSPPIARALERLRSDLPGKADVFVLFDDDAGNARPSWHVGVHRFSARQLAAEQGRDHLFPGYTTLPTMDFYRFRPDYDSYWMIEYDVRFSGAWSVLLDHFRESDADLLTARLRRYESGSRWAWWDSLEIPDGDVPLEDRLACFHPVCRYSNRALAELKRCYGDGWRGHSEVLIPTAIDQAGFHLLDLGGRGEWVRPEDRDRFYVAPQDELLVGRRWLDRSTFRWRPHFKRVGSRPETLYHPVKELGWELGHRQPNPFRAPVPVAERRSGSEYHEPRRGGSPRAAVIIPAYNAEAFVGEAVESVLGQEEGNLELIVVNDGSTDGTGEVLSRFSDPRLRVITTANQGVSESRNVGIEASTAPVLTFLDADDRFRPDKLRQELELLAAEPEVGLTFCNFIRFKDDGQWLAEQFQFYPDLPSVPVRNAAAGQGKVVEAEPFETFISFYDFPGWTTTLAVRRDVLGELRYRPRWWDEYGRLAFLEDLALTPRLFRRSAVAYLPEPLVEVRRHATNATADVRGTVVAILNSLFSLADEPLTESQAEALRHRIGRQLVSVGRLHVREGRLREGLSCFREAAAHGVRLGALKSLVKLPWDMGPGRIPVHERPGGGRPVRWEGVVERNRQTHGERGASREQAARAGG